MEKLLDELVLNDVRNHVCLYGFDEDQDDETNSVTFPVGHLEKRYRQVLRLQSVANISLSGALSLCEVTPAEWGMMQTLFDFSPQ